MSQLNIQEQNINTAKIVMSAFHKIADRNGATAEDVTKYLQYKFGDVWKTNVITTKAEETLKRSAALGFLNKRGKKYKERLARDRSRCRRKRRRKRSWFPCFKKRRRRRRRCPCRRS